MVFREGTLGRLSRVAVLLFTYRCWFASYTTPEFRLNTTGCPPDARAVIVRDTRVGCSAAVMVMLFNAVFGGVFNVDHFWPSADTIVCATALFWIG